MPKRKIRIPFRRKREGKTDYKRRLQLLKSGKPRFVVRRSLKNMIAQFAQYSENGDLILAAAHTNELKKYGWEKAKRNTTAAYLVGLLAGIKAKKKNLKEAVLDLGLYRSVRGGIFYAILKGVLDAGIEIPYSKEALPSEERIKGLHLKNVNFEEVKKKILEKN
ncbi:50S ribosomal protein L18 [Candidatus Woesearchaeota archaeon]|nr:50S ribosomal protein L18 [Candidatus Woesearchaeota archaeon]